MQKHIVVVAQYFYPEQFRINDICVEWIRKGYKVTVITGIPNYPQGSYYTGYGLFKKRKEIYKGVTILRLPLIPRGNNSVMLILNYLSFVVSGFFWQIFTKIKADYVFIFETSPMTQALVGVWYAKRKKVPCYLYVQDLWPENVEIITGIKSKIFIKPIEKMVQYIYSRATKIFTTSRSFITAIKKRGVSLDKIHFWPQYAESFYFSSQKKKIPEIPSDNIFNITFAGNIGKAQGLDILPKTAKLIKEKYPNHLIRFNVIGDGRYKKELIEIINLMNVNEMFNFIDRQPPTRIPEFLANSDVAFLCFLDNPLFSMTIPAKLQSYMACGIATIAAAAGETSEIINIANAGICSPPGDAHTLAENIITFSNKSKNELHEMGENAKKYCVENFNQETLLNEMDEYFTEQKEVNDA